MVFFWREIFSQEFLSHLKEMGKFCSIKYIQAGSQPGGNGSKCRPYNSLAQAEADLTWKTLIVLDSALALDGGILLRDGQSLIGQSQSIITNSSAARNQGNGVLVESGDVKIKNIHFRDTWASAIQYDNARDICVSNVFVTGHNQGLVIVNIAPYFSTLSQSVISVAEVAALQGQHSSDGTTSIKNLVVIDVNSGGAIFDTAINGAQRKLRIKDSRLTGIRTLLETTPVGLDDRLSIVSAFAYAGAKYQLEIRNSFLGDSLGNARFVLQQGIFMQALDGAQFDAVIKGNVIRNLFSERGLQAISIAGNSQTVLSNVTAGVHSVFIAVIKCNFLEEITGLQRNSNAIAWSTNNAITELVIKKNLMLTFLDVIDVTERGNSIASYQVDFNRASGAFSFFVIGTGTFMNDPNNLTSNVSLTDNIYTIGRRPIFVIVSRDGSVAPWNSLLINAEGNCFDGANANDTAITSVDFTNVGPRGLSNITIEAHQNNFTNYTNSVIQLSSNANINAQANWWGPVVPPVNNVPPGTVDVSNPLTAPILCVQSC
jgi:hypothetical protein